MGRPLTALAISKVKTTESRQEISDGSVPGLFLVVQPRTGVKSFVLRFRRKTDRKAIKLTLGRYAEKAEGEPVIGGFVTLAGARLLAARLQMERAQGKEPETPKRKQTEGRDYVSLARLFIEKHAKPNTRLWIACASRLGFDRHGGIKKGGLAEKWKDLLIDDITEDMIFHEVEFASSPSVRRGNLDLRTMRERASLLTPMPSQTLPDYLSAPSRPKCRTSPGE